MNDYSAEFIGLDTRYTTADHQRLRRLHLDGAASPLAASTALQTLQQFLPHYSNSHSVVHQSAKISTRAFAWAQQQILDYFNADPKEYTAVFLGAGTTAAVNRIARGLKHARPNKHVVLVSAMEHHANDLPHRQFDNQVHYIPLCGTGYQQGAIDLIEMQRLLETYQGKISYLTFSAVSNVTGIVNPTQDLIKMARQHQVPVLIDAAQAVAHLDIGFDNAFADADFVVFSGHKLYCPTAPGVMIAKRKSLEPLDGQDLGGGAVDDVSYYDYQLLTELPHKEQAGTPNIAGAVALAKVMNRLCELGRPNIEQHNRDLIAELQDALASLPHIRVYGESQADKISAIAFNHEHIDHGLLAAILNDYFMIALRNECFCAHPYVSSLLKEELWQLDLSGIEPEQHQAYINRKRGMVRASISLYNQSTDIERLIQALSEIDRRIEELARHYEAQPDGNYRHRDYPLDWRAELGW